MVLFRRFAGLVLSIGFATLLAVPVLAQVTADGHLPGPAARYSERASTGIIAHLDYSQGGVSVVYGFGEPGKPSATVPSIEEQGRILDRLMGRLRHDHPDLPERFMFFLAASRADLVQALDRRLLEPGTNWDTKRGRPRRGRFGDVLTRELNAVLQSSPIAKAVAAHGYALKLTDIERIDIERINGAHLPAYIDVMTIEASKTSSRGISSAYDGSAGRGSGTARGPAFAQHRPVLMPGTARANRPRHHDDPTPPTHRL